MSFVYQSASLQNKESSLFSRSASRPDWGNDCMLYHFHEWNKFLQKGYKTLLSSLCLLLAYYSADTCNENSTVNWLTEYIQVTCTDRTIANSIPCAALIKPRLVALNIEQNKLLNVANNISCILPYPCDVWRRITSSSTLKIYVTPFNSWARTLQSLNLSFDWWKKTDLTKRVL